VGGLLSKVGIKEKEKAQKLREEVVNFQFNKSEAAGSPYQPLKHPQKGAQRRSTKVKKSAESQDRTIQFQRARKKKTRSCSQGSGDRKIETIMMGIHSP